MGKPRQTPLSGVLPDLLAAESCVNCGYPLPKQSESAREVDVTFDDNEEDTVDLDDLQSIIEEATSLIEHQVNGGQEHETTEAKRKLTAALASDDLLNSTDFARQVAVTLDRKVPTTDYSAVAEFERLAA